ncbi:uncharacterized protein LOC128956781 [Oppia nitens]|uniref:uncharacterized protein LOC128956781 n=1 Tax=Oppia nitens TaxID=1686743 RepID=UPI0023DA772F|nr:uncharacterized protein LOC128956781 [Oppia nitens]
MFTNKQQVLLAALVVVISVGLSTAAGLADLLNRPDIKRGLTHICGPNLTKQQHQAVDQCDRTVIPANIRNGFTSCVRSSLGVKKFTKPMLCYRVQPGGEKMSPCLKKKREDNRRRLPPGVNLQELQKQIFDEYQTCLKRAIGQQ